MEVEMTIRGLLLDPVTQMPIVVLKDVGGDSVLPIWVGAYEAQAIQLELEKVSTPRPMTHDLIKNVLTGLETQVHKVVVTELREDTFYAVIWLERGGEGPLFAPLPPAADDDAATKVALRELKGLPVELVDVLAQAGHKTLQDIFDLEREDVDKIAGMTPELADKLMAFLNELTEEGSEDEAPADEPPVAGGTAPA